MRVLIGSLAVAALLLTPGIARADDDAPPTDAAETKPEEAKPDDVKSDEVKPDDAKPQDAKPDEVKPDDDKPDDAKPDEVKSDEAKPDDDKPDDEQKEAPPNGGATPSTTRSRSPTTGTANEGSTSLKRPTAAEGPATSTSDTPPTAPESPKLALPPLRIVLSKWSVQIYGFTELDMIQDTTQGLSDSAGNAALAAPGTFAANHQQLQFSVRNSRIGLAIAAPEFHSVQASGIVEMDFLGNEPTIQQTGTTQSGNAVTGGVSEAAFFNNPSFRIRHMALKLQTPVIDLLAGQYWELFGWQSYFHPNTVEIQGVPGQVYSRTAQLRISHTFASQWVNFDIAVAMLRPPERGSDVPDGQAGLKVTFNKWRGVRTGGATGTATDAASLGVSGVIRKFSVPALNASGEPMASATGSGISLDALVPVIPASADNRANGLTLTGSFVDGTGIADQYTGLTGGYTLPATIPGTGTPGKTYSAAIDTGLVDFDTSGNLQTINWQSFMVGLQYYLPPSGNIWVSANYSDLRSSNGSSMQNKLNSTLYSIQWVDANIFWDITPAVRTGFEYARFIDTWNQTVPTGIQNHNDRLQLSFWYIF